MELLILNFYDLTSSIFKMYFDEVFQYVHIHVHLNSKLFCCTFVRFGWDFIVQRVLGSFYRTVS